MIIGVVGPGTMGSGIAQVFAQCEGFEVRMGHYRSEERAALGKQRIEKGLAKQVAKGKMEQAEMEKILGRIQTGLYEILEPCDLIIESVVEKMDAKLELFQQLTKICKPNAIFATNTSSLSVTQMAAGLDRAVVGIHFFNPVPAMKLVEVVVGLTTPPELVEKIQELVGQIGKTPVVVKDSAGFVVNRILVPMINEAIGVFADNVASAADIDTAMKLGANHPMGPLALGDLIGLDVCLAVMEVLQHESGDPKYRPHPLLRKMVRGGQLGIKTGQGFFTY